MKFEKKLALESFEGVKSHLSEGFQILCVNKESSSYTRAGHGVPQGSVLGLLLFYSFFQFPCVL